MKKKRAFAVLLAAALCLGMLAAPATATEKQTPEIDITWLSVEGKPIFYIPVLNWLGIRSAQGCVFDLTNWVETPYDNIEYSFSEGLVWVEERESGDYVYLDKNGEVVLSIGSEYDQVWNFFDGLARVRSGGKYGFIDKTGNLVIPLEYGAATDFSEGLAWVRDGIDSRYESRYDAPPPPGGASTGSNTKIPPRYGLIDMAGQIVVPLEHEYESVYEFSDGLSRVGVEGVDIYGDSCTKYGFVDKTGAVVVPFEYDGASDFSDGVAWVMQEVWDDNEYDEVRHYGFIDKTGKFLTEMEYYSADMPSEGLARVRTSEGYGFIDTSGKVVISPKYEGAGNFFEGLACVRTCIHKRLSRV